MKFRIWVFLKCFILFQIISCKTDNERTTAISELIQTETRFSQYAAEHGTSEAFRTFMADSAVMFRIHPVKGRDSIMSKLFSKPSKTRLSWYPMFADVSKSCDLGYTYGPYERVIQDSAKGEKKFFGYFMTVWQKQQDGQWKFVLDTGTEPLPAKPQKDMDGK